MTSADLSVEPTYVGFSEAVPDLYEFQTASGVAVSLHELECVRINYLPLSRSLDLTFDNGSADLRPVMTVGLGFSGVAMYRWEAQGPAASEDVVETHPRVRGQVGSFITNRDVGGSGVSFHLLLLDLSLSFSAEVVTCVVTSAE